MLFEQKQQPHMWETESAKKAIIKCYLMNIESFCFKFEAHHESDRTWWEDEEKKTWNSLNIHSPNQWSFEFLKFPSARLYLSIMKSIYHRKKTTETLKA